MTYGGNELTPYEKARMDIQQANTYRIIGANASSWLATTKTLFQAILYASFPLAILFVMAPFGGISILRNYIMIFAWLMMWGPSYAVINMIANYSNKMQTGEVFSQGLTIANQMSVIRVQDQISNMAGYFVMLVPFLPLFLFQGIGAMSSLAHKLGSVTESTAGQVSGEVSTGNISAGNTSFNNTSANKYDASSFYKGQGHATRINDGGLSISSTASGQTVVDASGITSKLNTSFGVNQIESLSSNKAISSAINNGFSVSSTDGYSRSQTDSITDSMNYTKSASYDLSKSTGLSQSQILEASAGIRGGLGKAEFGARYGGSVNSSDAFNKIESFAKSEQFSEAFSYMKQNSMNQSISYTDSSGKTQTTTIDEALRTSQDYSNQLSQMKQISSIQSTGRTDEYVEYVYGKYGNEQAEGIFDHKNHNFDGVRQESFASFSQGNGSYNNLNRINEMETRAFLNKHSELNHQSTGHSNWQERDDVKRMIPNAKWNIDNDEARFDEKFQSNRQNIENKADDNVAIGSIKAIKEKFDGEG
jgi:conjugal transfer mating pair stabilization protein TraG